jgi:hypothetical protein
MDNDTDVRLTAYADTLSDTFGVEALRFLTAVRAIIQYFDEADTALRLPMTPREFTTTAHRVADVLGPAESARFFKAVTDTLPQYLRTLFKLRG